MALAIAFIFGWNNSGLCIGSLTSSGLLSYRRSVVLTSLGLVMGALIEGGKMERTLIGSVTENITTVALLSVFIITFSLMLVFTLLHIPISMSHVVVGAYAGASFASGLFLNIVNLEVIILSWLLVPILSALITILFYTLIVNIVKHFSLLTLDAFNRLSVMVIIFYIAYALGANNVGLINGLYTPFILDSTLLEFIVIVMAISVVLGTIIFSKRIMKTVGEDLIVLSPIGVLTSMFSSALLMWFFTQYSIPISITQAVIGGIVGAGFIKRHVIFNRTILYEVIGSWVAVMVIGFTLSFSIIKIFA
ncbi:MAG: inorganic phosphate transporter family protein [Candidatus Methylarchaceae archaeon HK02M1]|nr:inorganic phosphate transporter family protein [Candidatus Methylarchaceae archaeon HK02M1]